jgi:hypothetical protein
MNKKIIWGIVIILLVVLIGIAYYIFSYPKGNLCWPYCPGMTDQDREVIKKSALEDETANWKTYSDNNFSIKYPSNSKIYSCDSKIKDTCISPGKEISFTPQTSTALSNHDNLTVNIVEDSSETVNSMLNGWASASKKYVTIQKNVMIIDGANASKVLITFKNSNMQTVHLIFQKGKMIYDIVGNGIDADYYQGKVFTSFYLSFKSNNN